MKWRAFMVIVELVHLGKGSTSGEFRPRYLGELEADTEAEALELARLTWPLPAYCSTSKAVTGGHHVAKAAEMDERLRCEHEEPT